MVSVKQNMRFLGINHLIHHRQSLVLLPTRETSKIEVSLVSLEKNYFSQHFIICVGLYSTSEYYKSKCCVCLAVSVILGNGIKPMSEALTFEIES